MVHVQVGQGSVCGELLFAKWSVCGLELASGTGAVYVDLPTPTSLELQTDRQRLTCPGDPAAGLGLPTTAKLQVKVRRVEKAVTPSRLVALP